MKNKNFYVTTPIYYVNDKPHIGHAYTSIAADILARFKRLDGYTTMFLTGTDEHGQKVEKSALDNKKNPQDFVDEVAQYFINMSDELNLTNDDFIRTTEERHKKAVQFLWIELEKKGFIYKGLYKGWYALRDEAFYSEDELIKNAQGKFVAPSGAEVDWREEESYFFKLSAFGEKLLAHYESNPQALLPKGRYNEVVSFIKMGLNDLSISRSSFEWGIKVPNDTKSVIYVWLDALTNYISALGYPDFQNPKWKMWSNATHLVGKDIVRFHAVYWVAFLMALDLPLPKRIFAHGWWLNEGQKMSKSLGNALKPNDLIASYGLDAVRYFLFKEVTFGNDGDFNNNAIKNRINNELANEYGNLLQRTLTIYHKNFAGIISNQTFNQEQQNYLDNTNNVLDKCRHAIDNQNFTEYLENAWQIIRYANAYIDKTAPWNLIKNGEKEQAEQILHFVLDLVRRVSLLLNPVIPNATSNILNQLNIQENQRNFVSFNLTLNQHHKFNLPSVVFSKILE